MMISPYQQSILTTIHLTNILNTIKTLNLKLDCFQTKKKDYEANKKLRNMNVKNKDFVAFTQQLVFSNKHKICSGRELI